MKQNNNFLFNFQHFVESLRQDPEKSTLVTEYEKYYGSLNDKDYTKLPFYKEYLSKFKVDDTLMQKLRLPQNYLDDYDYYLLLQLVAGSFSSDYNLVHCEDSGDTILEISVRSDGRYVKKSLDDLSILQIHRLFEIYFDEQLNWALLMMDSKEEHEEISLRRKSLLNHYNASVNLLTQQRTRAAQRKCTKNDLLRHIS
ncbi:MAG: hypothetical protein K6F40_02070 [Bacteroidales bacterium]|nr:hypothetical protein [Bacteroidales bacterium]